VFAHSLSFDGDAIGKRLNVSAHTANLFVALILKLPPTRRESMQVALLYVNASAHHGRFLFQPLSQK
jgi:hypothetical protein